MTDLLSQEEIDALLRSSGDGGGGADAAPPAAGGGEPPAAPPSGGGAEPPSGGDEDEGPDPDFNVPQQVLDQLAEVANLSLGATSSVVQMLLNRPIEIAESKVRVVSYRVLAKEAGATEFIIAKIAYIEGFDGNSYLMLTKDISACVGDLMMGGEGKGAAFQDMHKSAVGELMNQMMGKTTTTLSEIFKKRVDIGPPEVVLENFQAKVPNLPDFSKKAGFLRIGFNIKIGDVAETEMIQLLPIEFAKVMAADLAKPAKAEPKHAPPPPPPPGAGLSGGPPPQGGMPPGGGMPGMPPGGMPGMPGMPPGGMPGMGMPGMGMPGMGMPGMGMPQMGMPGMGMPGMGMPGMGMPGMQSQVQGNPAEFGMLQMPMGVGLQSNIDLLLDVPLQITVELGRTRMLIKDVLELGIGSVVELNKLAGEAVEVFVNSKLIAKGEVVVIDENFAVRITSIVNPQDRLQAM